MMKKLSELGISPTPWKVDYSDDIDRVVNILDANNKTIVETDYGFYPPELPDARMMTAAPKLYEALCEAYLFIEQIADAMNGLPLDVMQNQLRARAALAEAAGGEVGNGK